LICTDELPQWAHGSLEDIDRNDNKFSRDADFEDGLRVTSVEREAGYSVFDFTGLGVALALRDLPREDDGNPMACRAMALGDSTCSM
jgi:hypothetical protein